MSINLENRLLFRDKVLGNARLVWGFEVVAPPINPKSTSQESNAVMAADALLNSLGAEINSIDVFLMPDLDPGEVGSNGKQPKAYIPPREYARLLRKNRADLETVIYRRTRQADINEQELWLIETARMGFTDIIPVGGDSSRKSYVGPSPIEFAGIINKLNKKRTTNYFQGAICIPSRGTERELDGMLEKEKAGISYFVTQYLFETSNIGVVYDQYKRKSEEFDKLPKRILIGITPITGGKNCEFLIGTLRVIVPDDVKNKILQYKNGPVEGSINYVTDILKRFFDEIYKKENNAKFGIYVGYTNSKFLGASIELFGRLKQELAGYELHRIPQPL